MAFEKENVFTLGDVLISAGVAFSDGFQLTEDSDEIMAVIPALMNSVDEFKEDFPSAIMYLGSQLMEKGADLRRAKATP